MNKSMSDKAKENAKVLLSESVQSQQRLQFYIQGCKDTMKLDGDWNLNTQTWEFEPKEDK